MGYACPVCEDPQSDATHLANHLAFTAMLRGGEHGEWLDDHVPEWADLDETELGERVAEHAEETEFPQVFEDTTDRGPGSHDHGDGSHSHPGGGHTDPGDLPAGADALADEALDEEAREAVAEAREMTRKRRENADVGSDGDGDDDTGDTGGDGTDRRDAGAGTETE
jgi:hypothetical protein